MIYIMNKHSHYFSVSKDVPISCERIKDCEVFSSLLSMYSKVRANTGWGNAEIAGSEIHITQRGGEVVSVCPMGNVNRIKDQTTEEYISEFLL